MTDSELECIKREAIEYAESIPEYPITVVINGIALKVIKTKNNYKVRVINFSI